MAANGFTADDRSMPLLRREDGQTMAEYSVALGVIVVVTVATFVALGEAATSLIQRVISAIGGLA